MTALIGFVFYRRRRGHTRSTGKSKDDDTIDLRLREPRAPEGHSPKTEPVPIKFSPPLKPRPKYDNYYLLEFMQQREHPIFLLQLRHRYPSEPMLR